MVRVAMREAKSDRVGLSRIKWNVDHFMKREHDTFEMLSFVEFFWVCFSRQFTKEMKKYLKK